MKSFTKSWPLLCGVLFGLCVLSLSTPQLNAQDIAWQRDIDSAMKLAKSEKKLVLLHFTASWCRPCQALEKFVFRNLEVARAVNQNVVAVEIDVDNDQAIVTEYGVTAVPYDIVITPGGRVITKQKSPLDSNGYRRMMDNLSNPVKELEDESKLALAQQVNNAMTQYDFKPKQLSEFQDHTPNAPSHTAPALPADAAEMVRRGRVSNPFFAEKAEAPEPVSLSNSFVAAPATSDATNSTPPVGTTDASDNNVSNSFFPEKNAIEHRFDAVKAQAEQLEATTPDYANDFLASKSAPVADVAATPGGFAVTQKQVAEVKPNVEPQLSFQANPSSQLKQLMPPSAAKTAPKVSQFAANVPAQRVQQDRFFNDPAQRNPYGQAPAAVPRQSAQRLLQPMQQPVVTTAQQFTRPGVQQHAQTANGQAAVQPQAIAATRSQQSPQRSPLELLNQANASARPAIAQASRGIQWTDGAAPGAKSDVRQAALLKPQFPAAQLATADSMPVGMNRQPVGTEPLESNSKVGLRGQCPVTLLKEGKWVEGNPKFGCFHRERLYLFANEAKLKAFRADPDFFSPILAGYDPVVFHENGQLIEGRAEHGVFMGQAPDQRILLFSNAETRARFQKEPTLFLNTVRQAMNSNGGSSSSMVR